MTWPSLCVSAVESDDVGLVAQCSLAARTWKKKMRIVSLQDTVPCTRRGLHGVFFDPQRGCHEISCNHLASISSIASICAQGSLPLRATHPVLTL
jgi:hypothetical protein